MRWFPPAFLISLLPVAALAQQQERNLIDRLLRPDMALQNHAQRKTFATNSAVVERRGRVGTFLLQPNLREKSFEGARVLREKQYASSSFNSGSHVNRQDQLRSANVPTAIEGTTARGIRNSPDANNTIATRSFDGQREFQEQGKSQKSLNRQNPPLTIEQVRELLNKNK